MAYSICRIAKLKSGGAIAASEQHTLRQRETPNADLSKENERFMGKTPIGSEVALEQEVFSRIGEQTIRKDAVLCVEILLTASPEFFRPDERGSAGKWDAQLLQSWKQANQDWLQGKFGDRIVRAELHLDESTPHIHAYLVPLDERGKLNCKSIFGGREKLIKFQDSYGVAMAPLGLERGIKGSRATHTQIKDYYAAITKEPDLTLTVEEIQSQLADRQRALKEKAELEQTAKALVANNEQLEQRLRVLQTELRTQQQEATSWKGKYEAMTRQLREIPLTQMAHELGLDPDPRDKHKWRNEYQVINITGSKFYDFHQMKGGGGAIDLVMHVERCNFSDAVTWLKDRWGESAAIQVITGQAEQVMAQKPRGEFVLPERSDEHWQSVREYLTRTRGLPGRLVDQLYDQGVIYADERQNAVFVRRSLEEGEVMGASLRGTAGVDNSFKGLAYGTRRSQGWFHTVAGGEGEDPIQRVVIVESAIDVLSYQTLFSPQVRTLYLSTDGAGYVPLEGLQKVPQIAIAVDRDEAGEDMALRLMQGLAQSERLVPSRKDWNEDLLAHLHNLQQQISERQQLIQEKEQKHQPGLGFSR